VDVSLNDVAVVHRDRGVGNNFVIHWVGLVKGLEVNGGTR
jgi:hypothetical protein